jgi:hypothetical protein
MKKKVTGREQFVAKHVLGGVIWLFVGNEPGSSI